MVMLRERWPLATAVVTSAPAGNFLAHRCEYPLICADRNSQHLRNRAEIQAPIRLIAIPDANRVKGAVLVVTFFNTHELALLDIIGPRRPEVHATEVASHQ